MTPPIPAAPFAGSAEILLHALLREEWRAGDFADGVLVDAARALGAGEARRAIRLLDAMAPDPADGDTTEVVRAFRGLATLLDTGWFPGGGSGARDPGTLPDLPFVPNPERATEPAAQVLVKTAWGLLGALPGWRAIVTEPSLAAAGLGLALQVLAELSGLGEGRATAPATLAVADLFARSGQPVEAATLLDMARGTYALLEDPVGAAACALVAGDWAAVGGAVGVHPETLMERLDGSPVRTAGTPDPAAAEAQWAAARSAFAAAGAERGLAAVALRRAAAAVDGDPGAAVALLDGAPADAGGDSALARLVEVHRALAVIAAGDRPDVDGLGAAVAAWGLGDGSRSFARGLARLCAARAARFRDRDVMRARLALRLAEAITAPLSAPPEVALLREGATRRYGATNYRRAVFLSIDADIADAEAAGTVEDATAWATLVSRVAAAGPPALGLRSGRAIARVAQHAGWLLDARPADARAEPAYEIAAQYLRELIAQCGIFEPLYRGADVRDHGEPDRAAPLFAAALAAAEDDPFSTAAVLATTGRREEAFAALRPLLTDPLPDVLVAMVIRLGHTDLAKAATADQPDGLPSGYPPERPWEALGAKADIQLGTGDVAGAAATAAAAIARVEEHIGGLSIDVLRTTAADDLAVAGLYATAIRAHTRLATDADLARGFELSDRCRVGALTDLLGRLGRVLGPTGAPAAVRRWQQAGAQLGETVDRLADALDGQVAGPDELPWDGEAVRQELAAAERVLDDAEAALAAAQPGELDTRRRLPATAGLAAIRERLAADTLLLQYHAFDDELIGWAVTADTARAVRCDIRTAALRERSWRWHNALARPSSTPAVLDPAAADLAALLLAPWADEITAHSRIIVVPHGPLSMLPFAALPWAGDALGAQRTLSVVPTATLLLTDPPAGPPATGSVVLVVGDPAYAPGRGLDPLPGTGAEARAVAALHGTAPLLGVEATHDAVLQRLPGARIVHLATHGLLWEGSPYRAELALAGEGRLTVPDLVGVETAIDLAVLSACDSGRGTVTAAGDLVGLTRALLAAGVRELIVSLWPVDDVLTCLTMVALHQELRGGATASAALRRAQARVRALRPEEADAWYDELDPDTVPAASRRTTREIPGEEGEPPDPAHPFSWAPFVHVGTT